MILFVANLIVENPAIPVVDLGFAISATAANAKQHFRKMQEVIKTFIDKYGSHRIAYSVLTFGSTPTIRVRFSDSANSDEVLKQSVENIPQNPGNASLAKALEGAEDLFKASNGARDDAVKVLVVITDKKSDSMAHAVKKAAEIFDEKDIRVIGIALGEEADGELVDVTDIKGDVINTTDSSSPAKIAEDVMKRLLDSKCCKLMFLSLVTRQETLRSFDNSVRATHFQEHFCRFLYSNSSFNSNKSPTFPHLAN